MKKRGVHIIIVIATVLTAVVLWIAFCGYQWNWGPFARLHDMKTASLPGNGARYGLDRVDAVPNSPLAGKTVVFLGSSVTYGASSKGVSFADYIGVRNNCTIIKEAVSGTTLVDEGIGSYISRLHKLDIPHADLFVCQLSTNDATQRKPLGEVTDTTNTDDFDTATIAGAIEYIIAYAQDAWGCPVAFYTNPQYDSTAYGEMVALLHQMTGKWGITMIDLWNDADFNDINAEQRALYMADGIHPTQAGYLEWWTPAMEPILFQTIEGGTP